MHRLSNPKPLFSPLGTVYTAKCQCGLDVYGKSLPQLWQQHQKHIETAREISMSNHPSKKRLT